MIEKPLKRFRLEMFARREENGEPAPAESIDVRAVANQEFHDRDAAGLGESLEGHVIDQD